MILMSNKSIGEWGELMGDPVLATAVLDRLLHHSHDFNIRGNSYRLKDKAKTGIYSPSSTQVGQFYSGVGGRMNSGVDSRRRCPGFNSS